MDEDIFNLNVTKAMHRIEDLYDRTGGKCYLSFSGGKDSTIVLALIKLCQDLGTIPENAIPALFANTRIELGVIVEFVKWVQSEWYGNVQILEPGMLFPEVLKKFGKPIKSKMKSKEFSSVWKNREKGVVCGAELRLIGTNPGAQYHKIMLANKDLHMIHPDFKIKCSNECCHQMKKVPFETYAKAHNCVGYMSGERMAEGGAREARFQKMINEGKNICTRITGKYVIKSPIVDWSDEMCDKFVEFYNVPLSRAYTEYGLKRTGCFLCPFAKELKLNLENLHENEPNKYKAALFYLKDVYIAQGVELEFDDNYMGEYRETWKKYDVMRYEMLKKYRPDSRLCKKYEKEMEAASGEI